MMRRVALLFALLFGVLLLPPGNVAAADVDLPTYVQRLTAAQDALTQARTLNGSLRDAAIQRAQAALAGIDGVTVDGTRYPPPHADALAALRHVPPDLDRALAQVTTLRSTLAGGGNGTPDPQARQKLNNVLSDRAFREPEPNAAQKQVARLRDWIGAQLRRLFQPARRVPQPKTPDTVPGANTASRLLALLASPLVVLLLALIAIAVIAVLVVRYRRRRAKRRTDDAEAPPRTAAEWREVADALAARGDHRAALRALFLGTLTELDERRLVAFDPALTDREYLREAQRQQRWLAEPLRPFVRLVEAVVYADAPCGAAEYARARAIVDSVHQLIAGPQGVAA